MDLAIDERRSGGLDSMLSGLIIAGVGAPVLVLHRKGGRALSAVAEKLKVTTTPPLPPPAPSAEPPTAT